MINIKIKGPNSEEGGCRHGEEEFAVIKPRIWIGRGEDVVEKEGLHSYALNLGPYSKAVSRLHAAILFSPAFFHPNWRTPPTYLTKLGHRWNAVGEKALALIWEFARPAKRVLLKDMQSKAGIFRKLESERLSAGKATITKA
jgi:hypothetical protein